MLQTDHDREFYLAKAQEHPQLDDIIRGRRTLVSTIDSLLCSTEQPGQDFADYLRMLADLGGCGMRMDDAREMPSCGMKEQARKASSIGSIGGVVTAVGYLALMVSWPPLGFLFAALFAAGGIGGTIGIIEGEASLARKRVLKRREKVLGPLRDVAGKFDNEIATFFATDHYTKVRDHFETMYPGLSDEQHRHVDAQLHRYLGAGGIPGMDEQQLKEYLSGLLAPQPRGDA